MKVVSLPQICLVKRQVTFIRHVKKYIFFPVVLFVVDLFEKPQHPSSDTGSGNRARQLDRVISRLAWRVATT